ncbi:MAG: ABC transporter permease subunit [Chloroflexota bacterium]|nr:ABC transporter permease subunit [Chloroflexota bacterium]
MTLLRIAVRSHRTGFIATALLAAIGGALNAVAFVQVAGTTATERAVFAQQMALLARQLSYLLPAPLQLDTMAGYLVWRAFGVIGITYAFWGLLSATGAGRGDEERGLVEEWLAAGVSRARWLVIRALAFALVAATSLVAGLAVTEVATIGLNEALPLGPLLLEGLLMWALALVSFALGIFISQLVTTRRGASTIGGVVLLALFLVNSSARSGLDVTPLRWLSPFYLAERSTPLLRGGSLDPVATAILVVAALVLLWLAGLAFMLRDVGAPLVRGPTRNSRAVWTASRDPLLRAPVLALVDQQRLWLLTWAIGLALLASFMTSLTKTIVDALASSEIPAMRIYFERAGITAYSDFVGVIWFATLLLLISLFVVAQVNGWASDDAEGRLETILSAPVSRTRVVVERIAAAIVAVGLIVAASSVAVYATASANAIELPAGRFALASADVLPVAYAFAGIGHALVGWRPRLAVVALGAVAAIGYLTQQFAPLFGWPDWVKNTSLYALYGTPMSKDDWAGIATLIAIGTAGAAVALVVMRRRDVGR